MLGLKDCRPQIVRFVSKESFPFSCHRAVGFQDYLNFRYHDKRTAYVGELHRQLSKLLEGATREAVHDKDGCFKLGEFRSQVSEHANDLILASKHEGATQTQSAGSDALSHLRADFEAQCFNQGRLFVENNS